VAVMGARGRGLVGERAEPLVYSRPMAMAAHTLKPTGLARIFGWRRVRFVLIVSLMFGVLLNIGNQAPAVIVFARGMQSVVSAGRRADKKNLYGAAAPRPGPLAEHAAGRAWLRLRVLAQPVPGTVRLTPHAES